MTTVAVQAVSASGVSPLVGRCRDVQRRSMRLDAERLDLVAAVLRECVLAAPVAGLRVAEREAFVRQLATSEVAATFAVSEFVAARWVWLGERLTTVLPGALAALRTGLLDLPRVHVLADATAVLDDDLARQVTRDLVGGAEAMGGSVFDGPSPRAWKARVERAVVRADADAAAARQARARAARAVRAWAEPDGAGVFQLRADAADVAMVDRVVDDLAHAGPTHDEHGARLTLDQRRADAVVALFRQVGDAGAGAGAGAGAVPTVPVRRVTELGVVLHADTLFDDGPRRRATGEQRGLGPPAPLAPATARATAQRQLATGTGVQVIVVDPGGAVRHVVRLPASACTDRAALAEAVRNAPRHPLGTERYTPTVAIVRQVHAAAPTCSAYDCPRTATRCDLDHDDPWPRGPTSVNNLDPKCRRHHQAKTHGVVRCQLHHGPEGRHVTWTYRSGVTVTTRPEPLPGCG